MAVALPSNQLMAPQLAYRWGVITQRCVGAKLWHRLHP